MSHPYKPFLKQVAEYVYEHYKNNMHELSIIFPNKRARLFFNKYLTEITVKPIFSPAYYTISEYMQKLSGEVLADQFTLLFTLYEVYIRISGSKESFDNFLFYCEMLLADFDDIDKYLVNPEHLYQNLYELKELEAYHDYLTEEQLKAILQFWKVFTENNPDSPEKKNFSSLWLVLKKIYFEFNKELDKQGISYEGKAARKAIEKLAKGETEIQEDNVLFVGFNALNKCEEKLFKHLNDNKKGKFFWDHDEYYIEKGEFHEAAFFLKTLIRDFPKPFDFETDNHNLKKGKNIRIIDIPTQTGQAKALPELMKNLPADWLKEPSETAIALADESLLIPVLTSLPADIKEVNISMGYPLKDSLVYNFINILLDLHNNKRAAAGSELFYHKDVIRLIQHGFMRTYLEHKLQEISKEIQKSNLIFVQLSWLKEKHAIFGQFLQKDIAAGNFTEYLIQVLDNVPEALASLNEKSREIEKEALARIMGQLRRINDVFSSSKIDYSFRSLVKLIAKVLQGTSIPFNGEPLSGLQIMGILETRTLDFKNLIVLSMNEGTFPKSGNVPSLIPYTLRNAFKLPTVEHQDAIFGYYFYRLLQRAGNIQLVYCSSVNDAQKGEPSRFIQQIDYEPLFKTEKLTLGYKVYPQSVKSIKVCKSAETRNILKHKYCGENSRLMSPSAINTYLNCQLRFYFRYIAGIPEPEEILEEVEANTLGSILHKSMQILYSKIINKVSNKEDFEYIKKNKKSIEDAVIQAFWEEYISPDGKKEFPGVDKAEIKGKNILVKLVIIKYVNQLIDYDSQNAPLTILSLEDIHEAELAIDDEITLKTGGYIDRIDSKEGFIRIVDYKTGKTDQEFFSVENLFTDGADKRNNAAFQILLYSLVYSKNNKSEKTVPALFFLRNLGNKNYLPNLRMGKSKEIIADYSPLHDEFSEKLMETLQDIFSETGVFMQTESEKYCSYCPYINICNRNKK
ncbi:MAG: PD-(D/E)XK nuclease family protein [Bacteroidales bacterium]|nr:PD-(D/E)XK nuclease family protein [Bacteroidales bacterium]MBN2818819.1 PD-(D/E)XK nuclease family protein [Bacteroidales bacterium]